MIWLLCLSVSHNFTGTEPCCIHDEYGSTKNHYHPNNRSAYDLQLIQSLSAVFICTCFLPCCSVMMIKYLSLLDMVIFLPILIFIHAVCSLQLLVLTVLMHNKFKQVKVLAPICGQIQIICAHTNLTFIYHFGNIKWLCRCGKSFH